MKRAIFLIMLSLLLLGLVACGAPAETAVQAEAPADTIVLEELPDTVDVATAAALSERDDVFMLDVREQWEYDEGHIPNVNLISMNDVPARLDEIPTDQTVIVTCRSGNRSGQVASFLRENGFTNVHNMDGGILAWEAAGYPVEQ